jgi:hypothetical protein
MSSTWLLGIVSVLYAGQGVIDTACPLCGGYGEYPKPRTAREAG